MLKPFLTRRWLALTLVIAIIIPSFYELSQWQWRRLAGKETYNAVILKNRSLPAVQLSTLLAGNGPDRKISASDQWRNVQMTGTWDETRQVLVRKKSLQSDAGFWVMTPFVDESGVTFMINRGWRALDASAVDTPSVTPPPSGIVEVAARLRLAPERTKPRPSDIPEGQVDSVQPREIVTGTTPLLVNGYAEMTASAPQSHGDDIRLIPEQELTEGPHRSYAMQWLAFILVVLFGYGVLAKNEFNDAKTE